MAAAIGLRDDFDGPALRKFGKLTKDAAQARWLLALAAIYDGGSRTDAARISRSVVSGLSRSRARMKSRYGARIGRRCPPILAGATDPVRCARWLHFTTLKTATPKRLATARHVAPSRTAATTRSRRSFERGLAIHAGLLSSIDLESHPKLHGNPTIQKSSEPL
jgi:hypothetical protein